MNNTNPKFIYFFLIDVYWNPLAIATKECMGLFFSTKDIFGKFVEFNLLKGGAECSACEVNSMIKKRVRTMSFQPRKHSGMQQPEGYTYGVN